MTRFGFLALAVVLGGAAAAGATFAVVTFAERLAPPTDLNCAGLAEASISERVRVQGCALDFSSWRAEDHRFQTVTVQAGSGGAARLLYRTQDPEVRSLVRHLVELETLDEGGVGRYLKRHERYLGLLYTIEGRLVVPSSDEWAMSPNLPVVAQVDDPPLAGAIALLFALIFGLIFALLVRKQRRWEATRLAWERSQGILVEGGDAPRTF